jgi:hypothetical protein
MPWAFSSVVLTAGEAHDVTAYDALMEQRDSDPGAVPEIPTKSNRKVQHSVSKRLYRLRSRIECFIDHLKEQRRIATPMTKPQPASSASSYLLGCIRRWVRFVHRAWRVPSALSSRDLFAEP